MCVRVPVMIIEDKDSQHHAAGHHALDKVEVGSCSKKKDNLSINLCLMRLKLPIRGTASLVMGINSDTIFMKTVRDSSTVTPTIFDLKFQIL